MPYENNHYVPRCLVKRWENADKQVCYYSFSEKKINKKSSKNIFAEKEIFPKNIETFLQKKIETPLGDFIRQFHKRYYGKPITNWRVFRSIFLYFITQPARFSIAKSLEYNNLKGLIHKGNEHLDRLVQSLMMEFKLVYLECPVGHWIALPDCGFFSMPIIKPNTSHNLGQAFVLPFGPTFALSLVPSSINEDIVKQQNVYLNRHSVCPGDHIDCVVLPYSELYFGEKSEFYENALIEMRKSLSFEFELLAERERLVSK